MRSHDAQTGRFIQVDPYDEFPGPYTGMGNNPVSGVDPSGGFSLPVIADLGSDFLNAVGNVAISTAIGYGIGYLAAGKEGAKWGAGIGFGLSAGSYVPWADVGNWATGLFSGGEWLPLYKADLMRYANTANDNILGKIFENLFGNFAKSDPLMIASNVRPNGGKFTGGFRNTVPDFVGDAYVSEKKGNIRVNTTIKGADWYELKQQTGGLYLSSNEGQIAGHIDNIRNSTDYAYKKYGRLGYQSKLYVVTTADVKYSENIYERAFKNNVLYEHIHA